MAVAAMAAVVAAAAVATTAGARAEGGVSKQRKYRFHMGSFTVDSPQ